MLSNSIEQLSDHTLLVIRNGRQEVHARTLTSVCKSGISEIAVERHPLAAAVSVLIRKH